MVDFWIMVGLVAFGALAIAGLVAMRARKRREHWTLFDVALAFAALLWISGGAEMNYRSQFKNFEILDDYSPWQKSALLGISKRYRISKKVKGNMQLMYDFLSSQQIPKTQPVVFRIGYIW